jgi:cytoskeletal protein CcmA (bactofilin family)
VSDSPQTTEPFTFVADGTTVEGSIRSAGRLRIDGTVRGPVHVEGVLEVAATGRIEQGPVHAERMVLLGAVHADVVCAGLVEILSSAEVHGRIQAAKLDLEEGARFVGESAPLEESQAALAAGSSALDAPAGDERGIGHGA